MYCLLFHGQVDWSLLEEKHRIWNVSLYPNKGIKPDDTNTNFVNFNKSISCFQETLTHYPFSEVISTRKVKSEDGTLFLDMKCGNLMQQRITRLQTDQAHEISRLIRQYITMEQRLQQRSAAWFIMKYCEWCDSSVLASYAYLLYLI